MQQLEIDVYDQGVKQRPSARILPFHPFVLSQRNLPASTRWSTGSPLDGRQINTGGCRNFCYSSPMSQVAELIKEAAKLDPVDRAELVSSLLEDLDPNPHWVTDEEALGRLEDLKSGSVKGLSEEDFWKACGRS